MKIYKTHEKTRLDFLVSAVVNNVGINALLSLYAIKRYYSVLRIVKLVIILNEMQLPAG